LSNNDDLNIFIQNGKKGKEGKPLERQKERVCGRGRIVAK
jgi:hypothetical protein